MLNFSYKTVDTLNEFLTTQSKPMNADIAKLILTVNR